MRKALPYLVPGSPFPGSIFLYPNTASFETALLGACGSTRRPRLSPAWFSLPCLLCLDNTHSAKLFKILPHHQRSGISTPATHADIQTGSQCDYASNWCLVLFFHIGKQYGVNCWNSGVPLPGLTFQFWHLQSVWPESGYLSFLNLNFLFCKMGLVPTAALLWVMCNHTHKEPACSKHTIALLFFLSFFLFITCFTFGYTFRNSLILHQ